MNADLRNVSPLSVALGATLVLCATVFVLTGCNQRSVDEAVIRTALEKHIAKNPDKCGLTGRFPLEVPRRYTPTEEANGASGSITKYMNEAKLVALEKSGLISRRGALDEGDGTRRYQLTDVGRRHYQELEIKYESSNSPGEISGWLCYAKIALKDGIEWQGPHPSRTNTSFTFVHYHIEFREIPAWATSPEVLAAFPEMRRELIPGPIAKQTQSLVLTKDGWVVAPDRYGPRISVTRVK